MLSKRYGSTKVDRRTWLHVPLKMSEKKPHMIWYAFLFNDQTDFIHKLERWKVIYLLI